MLKQLKTVKFFKKVTFFKKSARSILQKSLVKVGGPKTYFTSPLTGYAPSNQNTFSSFYKQNVTPNILRSPKFFLQIEISLRKSIMIHCKNSLHIILFLPGPSHPLVYQCLFLQDPPGLLPHD